MSFSTKWALPLLIAGLLATVWGRAPDPAAADQPPAEANHSLVVHEWGTFSTFSGSNGKNLKFEPYDSDLPAFVHGYQQRQSKAGPAGGTISLETPVVYLYAEQALTASVEVEFPKGILTEWYPHADRTDHQLAWRGVEVLPADKTKLPRETSESRYYAARATEAAPLRVTFQQGRSPVTEQEKFLFYRGVGTFDMPLSVRARGNGKFTVTWTGKAPGSDLILVRVQDKKIRFQQFGLDHPAEDGVQAEVQVPDRDATAAKLGEALVKLLTARGLFEKEAQAMVKTWSSAWFGEEGTRVLYFLPEALTEELLPLQVKPRPSAVVRVLVGRHDVLTPEREKQIDALVAEVNRPTLERDSKQKAAWQELLKLDRYHGAAQRAAEARLKRGR